MATTDSLDTILSSLHDLENGILILSNCKSILNLCIVVKTVNEDLLRKEIDQRKTIEMQVQKGRQLHGIIENLSY